jgi:hypothetical protein
LWGDVTPIAHASPRGFDKLRIGAHAFGTSIMSPFARLPIRNDAVTGAHALVHAWLKLMPPEPGRTKH